MTWQRWSVFAVWLLAIVGALAVAVFAPGAHLTWLPIVLASTILVTFAIQLGIQRTEGYVERATASICGSIVVLAIATGLLALQVGWQHAAGA
jgi:hypothetical protein